MLDKHVYFRLVGSWHLVFVWRISVSDGTLVLAHYCLKGIIGQNLEDG